MYLKNIKVKNFRTERESNVDFNFGGNAEYYPEIVFSSNMVEAIKIFLSQVIDENCLTPTANDVYCELLLPYNNNIKKAYPKDILIEGTINIGGEDFTYAVRGSEKECNARVYDKAAYEARLAFLDLLNDSKSTLPLIRYYGEDFGVDRRIEESFPMSKMYVGNERRGGYVDWGMSSIRLLDIFCRLTNYYMAEYFLKKDIMELNAFRELFKKWAYISHFDIMSEEKFELMPINNYLVYHGDEISLILNNIYYDTLKATSVALDLILRAINLNPRIVEDNITIGGIVLYANYGSVFSLNETLIDPNSSALSTIFPGVQMIRGV